MSEDISDTARMRIKNGGPVEALLKIWPLVLALVSIVAAWATMHAQIDRLEERVTDNADRISRIEEHRDEDRKALDQSLDGIRSALGRQQLTLARICVMLSPKGKECE